MLNIDATLTITEAIAFLRRSGTKVLIYSHLLDSHLPSTKSDVISSLLWLQQATGAEDLGAQGGPLRLKTKWLTNTLYIDYR